MKCLFTFLCFIVSLLQPIIYKLPPKGERKAVHWIRSLSKDTQDSVFFRIGKRSIGSHELVICCCTIDNDRWSNIALLSNRYLRINNKFYPLILDYDDYYSLTSEQTLSIPGEIGSREGLIKRVLTIFHGYSFVIKNKNILSKHLGLENKPALFKNGSSPIVYFINDSIENAVFSYLDSTCQFQGSYFAYFSEENDLCELKLSFVEQEESLTRTTNRFLMIDKVLVPLFFDYDALFWFDENQKELLVTDRRGIAITWDSKYTSIINLKELM